jgi:hypothetical protein
VYLDYRNIAVSALPARSPDLLGRAKRSSPMPHGGAPKGGLDSESADRAIINVTAMRVVVGHCPRDQVPDFTPNPFKLVEAND